MRPGSEAGAAPAVPPSDAPVGAAPAVPPPSTPADAPSDASAQTGSPTPPDQAAAPDSQGQDESGDQDDERTTRITPRHTNPYAPPSDDQK